MINYIKLGKVRGLCVEINRELGLKPFFKKNGFHHETIIDIPYAQIIYTSSKWCDKKRVLIRSVANANQKTKQVAKCSKRTSGH